MSNKKCIRCGGKGYLEGWYHFANKARPTVMQCCDIRAYSVRVQEMTDANKPAAELFKKIGKYTPLITPCFSVTRNGIQFQGAKRSDIPTPKGKPCPVIPLRKP